MIQILYISIADLKVQTSFTPFALLHFLQEVEKKLGIRALDIYGLSEVIGPGVSMQCPESEHGMHVLEDHFLPEIVDPDTFEPLPPGQPVYHCESILEFDRRY